MDRCKYSICASISLATGIANILYQNTKVRMKNQTLALQLFSTPILTQPCS